MKIYVAIGVLLGFYSYTSSRGLSAALTVHGLLVAAMFTLIWYLAGWCVAWVLRSVALVFDRMKGDE